MNSPSFLHLHTHFSSMGGPASPADWCRAAARLGYKSIAIADRGPLAGFPSFAWAARDAGLQPVFGMEVDILLPGSDKKQPVVLFVRNEQGLTSLAKIAVTAYARWPLEEKAVPWDVLATHPAGLALVLLGSEEDGSASMFVEAPADRQLEWGSIVTAQFGEEAFVGLPHPGGPQDAQEGRLAEKVATVARQSGLRPLAMPAARYLQAEDALAYRALRTARAHAGWGNVASEIGAGGAQAEYLRTPGEMEAAYSPWPEALENSERLAQMCSGVDILSLYAAKPGVGAEERAKLQNIAEERLLKLLSTETLPDDVQHRLVIELAALQAKNALSAWSALAAMGDVLQDTGRGRPQTPLGAPLGTADGLLLAYALGLSPLNPAQYALSAWLQNEGDGVRDYLPPPGVEVPTGKRDTLLAAITRKYGAQSTALAACPVDIEPLAAVWAASRALDLPAGEAQALALQAMLHGWDALAGDEGSPAAKIAYSLQGAPLSFKPDADMLLVGAEGELPPAWLPVLHLEGACAGGWVPWSEETVARLGLPALTLRPSASLELLDRALQLAAQYPVPGIAAEELQLSAFPHLALEAAASILKGEVLGIPYFSPAAVKGWKGAIDSDGAAAIVARSLTHGKPGSAPNLDIWAENTAGTAGILLYRDQFDTIVQACAGIASYESARLRRAMLSRDAEVVESARSSFVESCGAHDLDEETAGALWQELSASSAGLHSRSAATAWGRLAAWVAHLKAMHPAAFMAALLGVNSEGMHLSVSLLADEARRLGVTIKPPNIDYSLPTPTLERDGPAWALLWGLALLPGWSKAGAERFVAARPKGGFAGVADFVLAAYDAQLNVEQLECLVRSGACDNLGKQKRSREALLEALPGWIQWAEIERNHVAATGQMDLFSQATAPLPTPPDERTTLGTELSPRERYLLRTWEKEKLGLGFTDAAEIEGLNKALEDSGHLRARLLTSAQLGEEHIGKSIYMVGLLTSIAVIAPRATGNGHKKGEDSATMATAWIEDTEGTMELVAFPPSYKRHADLWIESSLITITARVSKHGDGALYLLCEHMAAFHGVVEEAEMSVKVKPTNKKAPPVETTPAKPPRLETIVAGVPKAHTNGVANGVSNGSYTGGITASAAAPSPQGASPTMTNTPSNTPGNTPGEPANYRLSITLPVTNDDRADIDRMIALKEVLAEHPGSDIVLLRIPYNPETGALTTAQLPRGVAYSTLLEAQVVRLLGPDAMKVGKMEG